MDNTELEKKVLHLEGQVRGLERLMANHDHDGSQTPRIRNDDVIPMVRAMGSIEFSTANQTYSIGLSANPSAIWFNGFAVHYSSGTYGTGSIDMRSHVIGNAQLGKSFYFQPDTNNSVVQGGLPQEIIQSSSAFTIDSTTTPITIRTTVGQFNLVSVGYPNNAQANIVARLTVTRFTVDHIEVHTDYLHGGWGIIGNFMVI